MRRKIYFIAICAIGMFYTTNAQQNQKVYQGKTYHKINNEWNFYHSQTDEYFKVEGSVITVKFNPDVTENLINSFISKNNLILLRKAVTGWHDFELQPNTDVFEKVENLLDLHFVDKIEIPVYGKYTGVTNGVEEYVNNFSKSSVQSSDDPLRNQQWYLDQININQAWDITTGSPDVIVAVIDSGVDWQHEDLGLGADSYQNIFLNSNEDSWTNPNNPATGNGIDNDNNSYTDDWKGWNFQNNNNDSRNNFPYTPNVPLVNPFYHHGTIATGIIGAKSHNGIGISGIAGGWDNEGVKLLICNIGDINPDSSTIDDAILYSGAMGAKVINMSFWTYSNTESISNAIDYVYNQYGTVCVASTGNNGTEGILFPASHNKVISVGATDNIENRWSGLDVCGENTIGSNYGENLIISAPGVDMYSTKNNDMYGYILANGINEPCGEISLPATGTSYSAPIVSGVIALMLSVNPCLTPEQTKEILKQTADKVGGYNYDWNSENPGHSKELGYGRINAYEAVFMAQQIYTSGYDLMVRDDKNDVGVESYNIEVTWNSPDIWVRSDNDGMENQQHENPQYQLATSRYVYVRVKNKGCQASSGTDELTVYWSKASTSMNFPQDWNGYFQNGGPLRGAEVGTVTIPVLETGEEKILELEWDNMPNPLNYVNLEPSIDLGGDWHFCLLAVINGAGDPTDDSVLPSTSQFVKKNNNVAQKNISIIKPLIGRISGTVAVGNPTNNTRSFNLNFLADDAETGTLIFEEAEVRLTLGETLLTAWEDGGKQRNNMVQTGENALLITGDNASLNNLILDRNEIGTLNLQFNFLTQEVTEKEKYVYHVFQRYASDNEIVGGETYEIRKDPRALFFADAGENTQIDKNEPITLSAETLNEPAVYNWYDSEGNLIYEGADFTTSVEIAETYKLEIIALADGYKDYSEVQVSLNPDTIETIYPNPASDQVTIAYKINQGDTAYLSLTGFYGSNISNNYILNITENEISLDISSYPQGFYAVALVVNGQMQDTKTIIKQ